VKAAMYFFYRLGGKGLLFTTGLAKGIVEGLDGMCIQRLYELFVIPGNHDYCEENRRHFDVFLERNGITNPLKDGVPVGACKVEHMNFVFCDSINQGIHDKPEKLDLEEIRSNVKPDKENILLLHHSLLFEDEESHTGIVNYSATIDALHSCGIRFAFHGHAHATRLFNVVEDICLVGVGSFMAETSGYMENSVHQFNLVNISGKFIEQIVNYRFTGDQDEYLPHQIYPSLPKYTDPREMLREQYDYIEGYIARSVLPYQLTKESKQVLPFDPSSKATLIEVTQYEAQVVLVSDAGMGKSTELKQLAATFCAEEKQKSPCFLKLAHYNGGTVHDILPKSAQSLNPASSVLIMDGYDEIPDQHRTTFRQNLIHYTKNNPKTKIIFSMRSVFVQESSELYHSFRFCKLLELTSDDVGARLALEDISLAVFMKEVNRRDLTKLLYTPFYLENLIKFFRHHSQV